MYYWNGKRLLLGVLLLFGGLLLQAQGPPILGDKPIMLGAKRVVLKTLTEFRQIERGYALKAPLMAHYLPTSNTLVGLYTPLVTYQLDKQASIALGDLALVAKYQFFRKDGKGKTFRAVFKTLQTLPTGPKLALEGMSTGQYQGFYSIVAGYETIKYGLNAELGYNYSPMPNLNEVRLKMGAGLPLLKPTYPVNQLNLYFEYQGSYLTTQQRWLLLYAQGIQYAKGRVTVEAALQLPLFQTLLPEQRRIYSLFLGMRYVI